MRSALRGSDRVQPSGTCGLKMDGEHTGAGGRPLTVAQANEELVNDWEKVTETQRISRGRA